MSLNYFCHVSLVRSYASSVISTTNGIGITATLSQVIAYFCWDQYVAEATKTGEKVVRVYLESIVALPLVVFQARRTNVKSLLNFC